MTQTGGIAKREMCRNLHFGNKQTKNHTHQTRTGKTLLVMVLVIFVMEIHYKIE